MYKSKPIVSQKFFKIPGMDASSCYKYEKRTREPRCFKKPQKTGKREKWKVKERRLAYKSP